MSHEGLERPLDDVLAFRQLLGEGDAPLADILVAALQKVSLPAPVPGGSEAQMLAAALEPYVRIAGLTAMMFAVERDPAAVAIQASLGSNRRRR